MRKVAAFGLCLTFLSTLVTMPAHAIQDYTVSLPFVFNHWVSRVQGDLVMTEGESDERRGYVYTLSGEPVQTEPNDAEFLENGYIKIMPEGSKKWTVYREDGTRVFPQSYDYVTVTTQAIALVADGFWRPPGDFYGKFGAIDLSTGSTLIAPAYDELEISSDGKSFWASNGYGETPELHVFDLKGNEVTDAVDYVAVSAYQNGYYKVRDPKTGLYGLADTEGTLCVPTLYDDLGDKVLSGAVLVRKGQSWGVSTIDGSGKLLQPVEYNDARNYENDLCSLKKWSWVTDGSDPNTITVYYGDGSLAFPSESYNAVLGVCGDVIYVRRKGDDALIGLSKTGEVLVPPIAGGYLSFDVDGFDFVLIGRYNEDGYGDPAGSMVINRWGEIIAPFDAGNLLSDGVGGKGLSLLNIGTGQTSHLMADGRRLTMLNVPYYIDYDRGWVIYNDTDDAWITDLNGNTLIPKGIYRRLDATSCTFISGQYVKEGRPDVLAQDRNGKYGALSLTPAPYAFEAHDWAKQDIADAISAELVPRDQQRDWRDSCTRGDFCRLLAPLLDKANEQGADGVAFTDTQDPDILRAASLGIVIGVGGGKFAPNRPISREQAAVMLARAAGALGITADGASLTFTDADTFDEWAQAGIASVTSIQCGRGGERVMQGVTGNRFVPRGCYTREQSILTILRLYRALSRKDSHHSE